MIASLWTTSCIIIMLIRCFSVSNVLTNGMANENLFTKQFVQWHRTHNYYKNEKNISPILCFIIPMLRVIKAKNDTWDNSDNVWFAINKQWQKILMRLCENKAALSCAASIDFLIFIYWLSIDFYHNQPKSNSEWKFQCLKWQVLNLRKREKKLNVSDGIDYFLLWAVSKKS